ncbi:MAG: tetratricopeptide repeat protein [Gammaproteobacteria bacterium]|nr:tetratricopeptide repeat protein [Gammaproteobacteria bacterium]
MTEPVDTFHEGYAAYRSGDYSRARTLLRTSRQPQAVHLLGLVERRSGNYTDASRWLTRAAELEPTNHEIPHNQALLALDTGNAGQAEQFCHVALSLNSEFFTARNTLARALRLQKRWQEARVLYEHQLAIDPANVVAHFGMATVLLETGDAELARAALDALIAAHPDDAAMLFMRGRAHQELGQLTAAVADYQASHALEPTGHTLRVLTNLLWMTDDLQGVDRLLEAAGSIPTLLSTRAELLRERGTPDDAVVAVQATSIQELGADELAVLALAQIDRNEPDAAMQSAQQALNIEPTHPLATSALITGLLMQGKGDQALELIYPMRRSDPLGQHWIAYEATALRLCRPRDYAQLTDLDKFVRSFELPTPPGYRSLQHFNEVFLSELKSHHHYKSHPLNQSLRNGSQTSRDLRGIDRQVIQDYFAALDTPIRQYLEAVGDSADHPLTARNNGTYEFAGCWSVLLHGTGRHINHVHPEGWISSAYYVSVPAECEDETAKSGWIKFAEPPFATTPPSPPQKWLQPRAGLVVLFPSFMWHGTTPIANRSFRVTAPFDLVPGTVQPPG